MREIPLVFYCEEESLVGIVAVPERAGRLGVLIIVGGPQYRVGSHRQFVSLARAMAHEGVASLRFDYRGMGDSSGEARGFEEIGLDIRAAVDALFRQVPVLEGVVLWGLCDGASAALTYAPSDPRVAGAVVLNPWVRSEASLASARIHHHYASRIRSIEFWRKLVSGRVGVWRAASGFLGTLATHFRRTDISRGEGRRTYQDRMVAGWTHLGDGTLLVLSERDLTAQEFQEFCLARPAMRSALESGSRCVRIADADHTFSRHDWKKRVERATIDWIKARSVAWNCDAIALDNRCERKERA